MINLKEDNPDHLDSVISFLYKQAYDVPSVRSSEGYNQFEWDTCVYALADKYGIPTLKQFIIQKLKAIFEEEKIDDNAFISSIETTWTSTPLSDKGLREPFMERILCYREDYFRRPYFENLLIRSERLAADLLMAEFALDSRKQAQPLTLKTYTECHKCKEVSRIGCLECRGKDVSVCHRY